MTFDLFQLYIRVTHVIVIRYVNYLVRLREFTHLSIMNRLG